MEAILPDGSEVDWDKELAALSLPPNPFYKSIKDIPVPELVAQFAKVAPQPVQMAVRSTVAQLLGNLPEQIGDAAITASGQSIASLMFSMQMTGYMFRNAEYRRSLLESIESGSEVNSNPLPPVSGSITVKMGGSMEANVDAAAYMAELRSEVEGLRAQLAAKKRAERETEDALISFLGGLDRSEVVALTKSISEPVLDAMNKLISSILKDINVDENAVMQTPIEKMRELLIWQLVSGYKLRELEVRHELKDKFWDQ